MKKDKRIIVWFRNDLRVEDNEALTEAIKDGGEILPVYVFDAPLLSADTPYGFRRIGARRLQFLLESVAALRSELEALGCPLIVRIGDPAEELFLLAKRYQVRSVYANWERTYEEALLQNDLEHRLWRIGAELNLYRGKMLYYTQDLPFPICQTPNCFNTFRREVQRFIPIRDPLPIPEQLTPCSADLELGALPTLEDFGYDAPPSPVEQSFQYTGGTVNGKDLVQAFFESKQRVEKYPEQRKFFGTSDGSSRLSAWLANGCISPKMVHAALKAHEALHGTSKGSQLFFQELLWRDFYRLMGKKHKKGIFSLTGLKGKDKMNLADNLEPFLAWTSGQTGTPIIDACMRALRQTGYISHKARQLVASYLIFELKCHWQLGAHYFESVLIDYDVCSTWLGWLDVAGLGTESREAQIINPDYYQSKYDPQRNYTDYWLNTSNLLESTKQ